MERKPKLVGGQKASNERTENLIEKTIKREREFDLRLPYPSRSSAIHSLPVLLIRF